MVGRRTPRWTRPRRGETVAPDSGTRYERAEACGRVKHRDSRARDRGVVRREGREAAESRSAAAAAISRGRRERARGDCSTHAAADPPRLCGCSETPTVKRRDDRGDRSGKREGVLRPPRAKAWLARPRDAEQELPVIVEHDRWPNVLHVRPGAFHGRTTEGPARVRLPTSLGSHARARPTLRFAVETPSIPPPDAQLALV